MICVDGNNCRLKSLKKADDFHLPDTRFILRKAKHFCTKLTGKEAGTEMYLLHESMFKVSHHFGIEDSRKMISQSIGEPFGQKEELSNRIRQILKGNDTKAHIFTEMIQNADDAGASEIRFIIDSRQLSTRKIFDECYEPLQGPALCCWNDAIFTDADYKGIVSLGDFTLILQKHCFLLKNLVVLIFNNNLKNFRYACTATKIGIWLFLRKITCSWEKLPKFTM